jgi:hypothetical protein
MAIGKVGALQEPLREEADVARLLGMLGKKTQKKLCEIIAGAGKCFSI